RLRRGVRDRADVRAWTLGPGRRCGGSRLVPTTANGAPAFGQYRPSGPGGRHEPGALQVIEISGGRITGLNQFLDTATLFPLFGLPERLEALPTRRRPRAAHARGRPGPALSRL